MNPLPAPAARPAERNAYHAAPALATLRAAPLLLTLAALAILAGSCMKTRDGNLAEFESLYQLRPNIMHRATPAESAAGGIPPRMTIIREENSLAATRNLVMAQEQLTESAGGGLRLLITPDMAAEAAQELRQLSAALEEFSRQVDEYEKDSGREKWAVDAAKVFAVIYRIDHGGEAADPRPYANRTFTHLSVGAPLARSVMEYLGRQQMEKPLFQNGRLLQDSERRRLVVQFGLAGAFQAADLKVPEGAPEAIMEIMSREPASAVVIQGELRRKLLELRERAEQDERPIRRDEVTRYLDLMPMVLINMARLLEQWDKFYLVELEMGEVDGLSVASIVADIRPGYEVRIDELHALAPALTGMGRFRLNFWQEKGDSPGAPSAVHLQCVSERGGQAAIRFEQWFYGLASLLAFPLDDWSMRSLDMVTVRPEPHLRKTTTTVLMELADCPPDEDCRRVLRVIQERRLVVETKGDSVDRFAETDRTIEFHSPKKVWYDSSTSRKLLPGP